jgi:hypothetical protein
VWDDTVTSIGAFRARHEVTDRSTPFGPMPGDPRKVEAWDAAATKLVQSRLWLQEHGSVGVATLRSRTRDELLDRRCDLDAILMTAPSDQRASIRCLIAGQISLTEAPELLHEALVTQGDRRTWILEHWPHIIESIEVDQALAAMPAVKIEPPHRAVWAMRELDHGLSIDLD